MLSYWRAEGLVLQESGQSLQECLVVDIWRGRSMGEFTMNMTTAVGKLQTNITAQLRSRQLMGQGKPRCIHVYAADAFNLLDQQSSIPFMYPAASGLFFNPQIVEAAQQILGAMRSRGHSVFWGVHLRLEADWGLARQPGQGLPGYIQTMKRAHFNSTSTVYIASGVFSYWNQSALSSMEQEFKSNGVLGTMYHKEFLMSPAQLQLFNPEQQALLDLLVLVEAQEFVGHPWSTFACFLRELRAMRGFPRSTFYSLFAQVGKRYFFGPVNPHRS